ncbi:hypothetical protein RRG08_037796 [Elysia crispata]|uniref:Uncharacterized protein n=1 Tax=Elysia crispata TaxID=231223 RepID=A0AAE1BBX4_9GAST|nr:hypothetical protein RRG08_037796 [Elysia crispata]
MQIIKRVKSGAKTVDAIAKSKQQPGSPSTCISPGDAAPHTSCFRTEYRTNSIALQVELRPSIDGADSPLLDLCFYTGRPANCWDYSSLVSRHSFGILKRFCLPMSPKREFSVLGNVSRDVPAQTGWRVLPDQSRLMHYVVSNRATVRECPLCNYLGSRNRTSMHYLVSNRATVRECPLCNYLGSRNRTSMHYVVSNRATVRECPLCNYLGSRNRTSMHYVVSNRTTVRECVVSVQLSRTTTVRECPLCNYLGSLNRTSQLEGCWTQQHSQQESGLGWRRWSREQRFYCSRSPCALLTVSGTDSSLESEKEEHFQDLTAALCGLGRGGKQQNVFYTALSTALIASTKSQPLERREQAERGKLKLIVWKRAWPEVESEITTLSWIQQPDLSLMITRGAH